MRKPFIFVLLLLLVDQPILTQGNCVETQEAQEPQGGAYKMRVDVPLTVVDFVVTDRKEKFFLRPNLNKTNVNEALEVREDGVPQEVVLFEPAEAEITVLLLIDYSRQSAFMSYWSEGEVWFGPLELIRKLKENDWIGIMLYDIKPEVWLEFTRNKREAESAIMYQLWRTPPRFSESNLSDAVWKVLDILEADENRRHRFVVVAISTGFDTFPRKNFFDDVLPRVKNSRIIFYPVSVGGNLRARYEDQLARESRYGDHMEFYVADSRLRSLAEASGGKAYFPRFVGEFPGIFQELKETLGNQYTIGYYPTNRNFNGKKRKIEIRFKKGFIFDINGDGLIDEKDKEEIKKAKFVHKKEYYPGREVE